MHFAELVAEKTGGSVEVQIFPSSTLHGWSEGIDALQGGVSDISWIPADDRLPCYRVTSLYPVAIDLEGQVEMDAAYADLVRDEAAEGGSCRFSTRTTPKTRNGGSKGRSRTSAT